MEGGVTIATPEQFIRERYGTSWDELVQRVANFTRGQPFYEEFLTWMRRGAIVPGGALLRHGDAIDPNRRPGMVVPWANCYIIAGGDCLDSFRNVFRAIEPILEQGAGVAIDVSRIPYWHMEEIIEIVQLKVDELLHTTTKPPVITLSGFSAHIFFVIGKLKDPSSHGAYINLALCLHHMEMDQIIVWNPTLDFHNRQWDRVIWDNYVDLYLQCAQDNVPMPVKSSYFYEGVQRDYSIEESYLWRQQDLAEAIQRGRLSINNLTRMLNPDHLTAKEKEANMRCTALNVCMEIAIPIDNDCCLAPEPCALRQAKNNSPVSRAITPRVPREVPREVSSTDQPLSSSTPEEALKVGVRCACGQENEPEDPVAPEPDPDQPEPTQPQPEPEPQPEPSKPEPEPEPAPEPEEPAEPAQPEPAEPAEPEPEPDEAGEAQLTLPGVCILASINIAQALSIEEFQRATRVLVQALAMPCLHPKGREKNIGISIMGMGHVTAEVAAKRRQAIYKTVVEEAVKHDIVRSLCQAPLQSTAPIVGLSPSIHPPLRGPNPVYEARMNNQLYRFPLRSAPTFLCDGSRDAVLEGCVMRVKTLVDELAVYGRQFHSLSAIFFASITFPSVQCLMKLIYTMKDSPNKNVIYYCNRYAEPMNEYQWECNSCKRARVDEDWPAKRVCHDCE